jgi:hypothetical protein
VFTTTQALTASLAIGVALGDIDGDGDLDAAIADNNAPNRLLINQGGAQAGTEGIFQDSGQILGQNNNRDLALVDVDVDGDLDLFVARTGADQVWVNQGGVQGSTLGALADSGQALGSTFSDGVALGDIDGDNDPDAVLANIGPMQVWRNEGLSGLETLYRVRDDVLSNTPQGLHYIDLFYQNNPEILALILGNASLRQSGYGAVVLWLPNLAALVDSEPTDPVITAGQVQAVDDFLTDLSAAGSPSLQATLAAERSAMPPLDDFVGMTMTEARVTAVGPYRLLLPLATNGMPVDWQSPAQVIPSQANVSRAIGPAAPHGGNCVLYCLFTGDCD